MFTLRIRNQNAQVLFSEAPEVLRLDRHGFEPVQRLTCLIVGDSNRQLGVGHAVKSSMDDEDALLGMELALGRALQQATPDKTERAKVWKAFYHSVNDHERDAALEALASIPPEAFKEPCGEVIAFPAYTPPNPRIAEVERELSEARQGHSSEAAASLCPACQLLRTELASLRAAA